MKEFIDRFIDYLHSNRRYSQHTLTAYRADLYQLKEYLETQYEIQYFEKTSFIHLRSYIVYLKSQSITHKTINRKISSIKTFYKYLLRQGVIHVDITEKLISPKIKKTLPQYVKEDEPDLLIEKYTDFDSYVDVLGWIMFILFYHTGMRRSELIHLKNKDIDFYQRVIKVTGKGNKERFIPISDKVKEDLARFIHVRESHMGENTSPYVFLTPKGKKLYPKYVYNSINNLLGKITTLEKKSPHILRHTFATQLLNNGADLYAIKEILGHSSLAATQVYTHNSLTKIQAIYKKAHPRGE